MLPHPVTVTVAVVDLEVDRRRGQIESRTAGMAVLMRDVIMCLRLPLLSIVAVVLRCPVKAAESKNGLILLDP